MEQDSQFRFVKSEHLPGLTILQAAMDGFAYDRHAHEEHSFGLTLAGRQDFFSGRDDPLNYVMIYVPASELEPLVAIAAGREQATDFRVNETLMQDPTLSQAILELARLISNKVGSRFEPDDITRKADVLLERAREFIQAHVTEDLALEYRVLSFFYDQWCWRRCYFTWRHRLVMSSFTCPYLFS